MLEFPDSYECNEKLLNGKEENLKEWIDKQRAFGMTVDDIYTRKQAGSFKEEGKQSGMRRRVWKIGMLRIVSGVNLEDVWK